ncbi:MAG: dihydrolipoyl dehydrogenase family protein, partial [Angustibacter sp.]
MNRYLEVDVAIIGGGSAGETIALRCAEGGLRVALIEAALVGGECPYYACIPAKSLLFSAAAGESWISAVELRDRHVKFRDDRAIVDQLQSAGVLVMRGFGQVVNESIIRVQQGDDAVFLNCEDVVIATGSEPVVPIIPGLDRRFMWTSDQALSSAELPRRVAILGGGPVGCELAQIYSRFGSTVTLIEAAERLLSSESEFISAQLQQVLISEGVDVRTSTEVLRTTAGNVALDLHLSCGGPLSVDRVIMAVGRRPQVEHLALERIGVNPADIASGLRIDDFGEIRPGLWAAGDVTGSTPFTHAANYQARAIALNILGGDYRMRLSAIPRAVYTEPAVLAVGERWDAQSAARGLIRAGFDLAD